MQYELLYIVPATLTDEDIGNVEGKVKAILDKVGAKMEDTKRLGKFRLAYPIKNVRHGHYMLVRMQLETSAVAKLDEGLRLSGDVLRHLILRADEAGDEKFDLVQFIEVNVDAKDDRPRRKKEDSAEVKTKATEVKADASALDEKPAAPVPTLGLSDEELNKKLAAALTEDAAGA